MTGAALVTMIVVVLVTAPNPEMLAVIVVAVPDPVAVKRAV
jgi:hypothetical protein